MISDRFIACQGFFYAVYSRRIWVLSLEVVMCY